MPENAKLCVDKLYLQHSEALIMADLEPVEFPSLSKLWKKEEEAQAKLSEKQVSSQGKNSGANLKTQDALQSKLAMGNNGV
eukprot:3089767-Ditylum_brightwellii.AAC.1